MRVLCAALTVLAFGCTDAGPPGYERDVRPLLARACVRCHDGGARSAEPPLVTRAQATRAADSIARSVRAREMPPWGPDETGLCGTFRGAGWLSRAEIELLSAWAKAGAPAGKPSKKKRREASAAAPTSSSASVVSFVASGPFSPGLGREASRCFVVNPPLQDVVATSASSPTGEGLLLSLFTLEDDGAVAAARAQEGDDPRPGFACPSDGPAGGQLLLSWSYVTPRLALPDNVGVRIPAGRALVFQARADLTMLGLSAVVRPRLDVVVADAKVARLVSLRAAGVVGVASTRRAETAVSYTVPEDESLLGVVPRMGSRGFTLKVEVERDGRRRCAAYFGHWHPSLEQLYVREEALALRRGDRAILTCAMTTRAAGSVDDDDATSTCAGALLLQRGP